MKKDNEKSIGCDKRKKMKKKRYGKLLPCVISGIFCLMNSGQSMASENTAYVIPETAQMEVSFYGINTDIHPVTGWKMYLNDRILMADHIGSEIRKGQFNIQETVSNKNFVNYRNNKEIQWNFLNTAKFSEDPSIIISPLASKRTDYKNSIQYNDGKLFAKNGYKLKPDLLAREYHMTGRFKDPQNVFHTMMNQSVRFRYKNGCYRVNYDYHLPIQTDVQETGTFVENYTYLSLPEMEIKQDGMDNNVARFHTVGWKVRASPEDLSGESVTGGEIFTVYSDVNFLKDSKWIQRNEVNFDNEINLSNEIDPDSEINLNNDAYSNRKNDFMTSMDSEEIIEDPEITVNSQYSEKHEAFEKCGTSGYSKTEEGQDFSDESEKENPPESQRINMKATSSEITNESIT